MNRTMPVVIALILTFGLLGSVSATGGYGTDCFEAACSPFSSTNSYIQQKAVTVAASNNAVVGDMITIEGSGTRTCDFRIIQWRVNQTPTLNSAHLTYVGTWCIVP